MERVHHYPPEPASNEWSKLVGEAEASNIEDVANLLDAAHILKKYIHAKEPEVEPDEDIKYHSEDEYDENYSDYDDDYYDDEEAREARELSLKVVDIPKEIIEEYDFVKDIPPHIALMGGCARSIARRIITGEQEPIRDIDLINIKLDPSAEDYYTSEQLDKMSQEFMPDDWNYGHGIRTETMDEYFSTRDFTINECLVIGNKLILSTDAEADFRDHIIRPTEYEYDDYYESYSGRIVLKSHMLKATASTYSLTEPTIAIDEGEIGQIYDFDMALFTNKAISRGPAVAKAFTRSLADAGILSSNFIDKPLNLAIQTIVDGEINFKFRDMSGAPESADPELPENAKRYVWNKDSLRAMHEYYASDPAIRKAIAEYEDGDHYQSESTGTDYIPDESHYEFYDHYIESVYDKINEWSDVDDDE